MFKEISYLGHNQNIHGLCFNSDTTVKQAGMTFKGKLTVKARITIFLVLIIIQIFFADLMFNFYFNFFQMTTIYISFLLLVFTKISYIHLILN